MARPTARWRSAVIACLFCGIAKLPMGISHEEQTIDILGALRARDASKRVLCRLRRFSAGAAAQINLPWQNWHRAIRNIEPNSWIGGPIFIQIYGRFSTDHVGAFVIDARPGGIGPPRAKWWHPRSRTHDPEAMAWTTVPTTGDANLAVFPKIRSQALLQAAERRSQEKAKMTASNATPAAGSSVGNMNTPATRATGRKGKAFTKWKPRPMIKPAPEDYVRVINPRKRVSLHEAFTETGYGTAISAYIGPERARATSVLPSRDQNIIIVHTPDIEEADRLIGDFAVNTEKGSVPLHGYLRQDGGNTCHGVIVVRDTDTTETLQHRVCWRAGTIVEIRKFGTSNKARITFAGKEKPHYVHYDSMIVFVQNYYKTIPACGQCGAVGHHADACPNLQPNTCGLCGLHAPLMDAKKGGKKKMTPKNKSRHLGQPSDQLPPHGGLEKRAAETHGKTGAWVNAVKNGRQVSNSGRAASSPPLPSARSAEKNQIAALRAQNEMLLKKINELEYKINQPLSPPSLPATEVIESELVEPKAATSAEATFEARFEALFGAIDARFATLENQISIMVTAISKLQDTIPAIIAQQIAHSSRPSRTRGGPYKDVSGRPLKTSRRIPEVDDSCSLSGMEDSALLVSAGSGAASLQSNLSLTDHGEEP
ncbi:hypothetical protein HPB49_002869 [Dermacentor silvarum]|uniref:Uncharacterized protein n=1 Tax=Dermacentor silvarum TaxID=543639 RepID=A0ACB8DAD3_DERSI|nr:hypothetical protein HPB49_002869 [Dermacentor silvarum]